MNRRRGYAFTTRDGNVFKVGAQLLAVLEAEYPDKDVSATLDTMSVKVNAGAYSYDYMGFLQAIRQWLYRAPIRKDVITTRTTAYAESNIPAVVAERNTPSTAAPQYDSTAVAVTELAKMKRLLGMRGNDKTGS